MLIGDEKWCINRVTRMIHSSHDEFLTYLNPSMDGSTDRLLVHWHPPLAGFVSLSVYGSCIEGSSTMGTGGLVRDGAGTWIIGFLSMEGHGEALLAELLAIKNGLQLTWDQGYRCVICESDCMGAVKLFSSNHYLELHSFAQVVLDIAGLPSRRWEVRVQHVFREANFCTNHLARLGARLHDKVKIWAEPPTEMGSLLLKDVLGVENPG